MVLSDLTYSRWYVYTVDTDKYPKSIIVNNCEPVHIDMLATELPNILEDIKGLSAFVVNHKLLCKHSDTIGLCKCPVVFDVDSIPTDDDMEELRSIFILALDKHQRGVDIFKYT